MACYTLLGGKKGILHKKVILWFRQDLRLSGNPGLYETARNGPVMSIYTLDEETPGNQ